MTTSGKDMSLNTLSSETDHTRHIIEEIKRSEESTVTGSSNVILSSWKRCVDEYKLGRSTYRGPEVVSTQEYQDASEPLDLLIHVAKPELNNLMAKVAPSHYVVMLSDALGISLDVLTSSTSDKELRRIGIQSGATWAEVHAGTNGIGTSIASGLPVTIHCDQHFFYNFSGLTCTDAPIFGHEGKVIAAIDTSSVAELSLEMQPFLRELVQKTARRIEWRYFLERHKKNAILHLRWGLSDIQPGQELLIALDDTERVIEVLTTPNNHVSFFDFQAILKHYLSEFIQVTWQDIKLENSNARIKRVGIARLKSNNRLCYASLIMPHNKSSTAHKAAKRSTSKPTDPRSTKLDLDQLAGEEHHLRQQVQTVKKLVNKRLPILLVGETGTGKGAFAEAIHGAGNYKDGPFITIDCSAIPDSLIESELFGYEKGSFTGARSMGRRGRIAQANHGTLFLDEIGDMPYHLQTRLLRVIAQQEVMPLGAGQPQKVDFNLICASHQNLEKMVSEGSFRQDLYYRIAAVKLELPALRNRTDIDSVILNALDLEAFEMGLETPPCLESKALERLASKEWMGNIRELRYALRFALAFAETDMIEIKHLPYWLTSDTCKQPKPINYKPDLKEVLERHQWCITEAATEFNVSRQTLYRWMKKQNIHRPNNSS